MRYRGLYLTCMSCQHATLHLTPCIAVHGSGHAHAIMCTALTAFTDMLCQIPMLTLHFNRFPLYARQANDQQTCLV